MSQQREYNPDGIENYWQKHWESSEMFRAEDCAERDKFYCLVMFPYPSGKLHVGHGRNYIMGDVVSRYKMMQGYNVLSPMGWDAFGLPAENAAIKNDIHPRDSVANNVKAMKRQIKSLGVEYDWQREINTSDPSYYKWTQWVFLKLHEAGLAYSQDAPVNWCPSCQTGLANEEVVDRACERCGTEVTEKDLPQWFFKITDYAEPLLEDLDQLDGWPERVRRMQADWIGRSEGAIIEFPIEGREDTLQCFTTRPDTLWGATFMCLAPEYPDLAELVEGTEYEDPVLDFAADAESQDIIERSAETVDKEGVFTGQYAINPVNGERIPIWVANYVLIEYGTGAVMAVPAHDQRDFEFAREYDIPIRPVIQPEGEQLDGDSMQEAYEGAGVMDNSGPFDGTPSEEGIEKVIDHLEENEWGEAEISYRLRDWLISRQRYWGAPIPIVHCDECGAVPVPEDDLPVLLPEEVDFTPTGESPLARVEDFVNTTCPQCGGEAQRETDTIAQWLCSCWYFLRFASPHRDDVPFDRDLVDYWLPVDQYIGGVEHAVLHLLYSRFVVKVLHDLDYVGFSEPFNALFTQGMILKNSYICDRCFRIVSDEPSVSEPCSCDYEESVQERQEQQIDCTPRLEKMSKSRGNVVSFDEVIQKYGADTLRMYTLAIGPPEKDAEWQEGGIVGYWRFLNRLWDATVSHEGDYDSVPRQGLTADELDGEDRRIFKLTHSTIRKVTEDIEESWHFNTAIASVMELFNEVSSMDLLDSYVGTETEAQMRSFNVYRFALENILLLLSPFVPHISEELWSRMENPPSIFEQEWPEFDPDAATFDEVELPVQVNGRVRDKMMAPRDADEDQLREMALDLDGVKKYVRDKEIAKVIVVPEQIVNVVVE
ncbi:MAG: leucine--tRNA ligase [Planctomycetota bacterium]